MNGVNFGSVDHGDPIASFLFLDIASALPAIQAVKSRSFDLMALSPGETALDVGCGLGSDALEIGKRVGPTGTVVGVDFSHAMVTEARRRLKAVRLAKTSPDDSAPIDRLAGLSFEQGDIYSLRFDDATFNACRADRILHFLDNPSAAINEMRRVVRAGGRVVVSEPDWSTLRIEGETVGEGSGVTDAILAYARSRRSQENCVGSHLASMLAAAGLVRVEVHIEETEIVDFATAWDLFHLGTLAVDACKAGALSVEKARAWRIRLQTADERGTFKGVLVGFTAVGTKPEM